MQGSRRFSVSCYYKSTQKSYIFIIKTPLLDIADTPTTCRCGCVNICFLKCLNISDIWPINFVFQFHNNCPIVSVWFAFGCVKLYRRRSAPRYFEEEKKVHFELLKLKKCLFTTRKKETVISHRFYYISFDHRIS